MKLNFSNNRALIRVDFNVPLNGKHEITDLTRINKALPTIQHILEAGGSVILMSHLGRPQKKKLDSGSINVEKFSLKHLVPTLSKILNRPVQFSSDCVGDEAIQKSMALNPGDVLLLENTRFYAEEAKGDDAFAARLAKLGDVYVNDAFGTAHRAHASTTTIAKYFKKANKCLGFLVEAEINNARKVLNSPQRPSTAILGGAKVSDKILLIEKLIDFADHILIGGGMAYTFAKAKGGQIGKSLCEDEHLDLALELLEKAKDQNCEIILPTDTVVADAFDNEANIDIVSTMDIPDQMMGLDIGPDTRAAFGKVINRSKTIIWNGPVGVFEFSNFSTGTFEVAKYIAEATDKGCFSLIGGGDSVSAINKSGLADRVSFISTGGGALLEFMEGKKLPAIVAINQAGIDEDN